MEMIKFERRGQVGWVTLTRPDKLNAQNRQMWDEMRELGREIGEDGDLRCLVVIGEGRAFSAGLDQSLIVGGGIADGVPDQPSQNGAPMVRPEQLPFYWIHKAPYPSIAAVRGYALGAGFQLALACDLRIFAEGTKVGLLEFRYGLLPDMGATEWLTRLVGPAVAKELIFTAAQIDATEAQRLGIANRVVPEGELEGAAESLAEQIAAAPPLAVRGSKRAVNAAFEPDGRSVQLALEGQMDCLRSEDFREAGRAFVEKRAPAYKGS
ncbi:MAG: enoyl-CoA hydratase/isomerase family protein [Dehalococcoidia bacterium]